MKRLRVPATIAFALVTTGTIAASAIGCDDDDKPKADAGACAQYCIPSSGSGGSNCPPPTCVDQSGNCPAGCEPEPIV